MQLGPRMMHWTNMHDLLRGSLALKYGYGRDWVFLVPCMGLEAIDMVEGGNMGLGP
jgi:hypothetical protein